jgi:hypothetical protein
MTNLMQDLLLIDSLNIAKLTSDYHEFFLGLIPSVFVLAALIEYFDRLAPLQLLRRGLISILILTSISSFYEVSIKTSMDAASEILSSAKDGNILLMDMLKGANHRSSVKYDKHQHDFYKNESYLGGTFKFLKYHLFNSFVNDAFTISVFFITKLCFLILKVVYSLVYYLGFALIGIPCLVYLFPSMGNVMRGGILSYLWCLITPHVLVFILMLLGSEINKGYIQGQVIGGSITGTALLFLMSLFIAFTPLISTMILAGSGVSAAGGIIASMGANYVLNLPSTIMNSGAKVAVGKGFGPKTTLAAKAVGGTYKASARTLSSLGSLSHSRGGERNNTSQSHFGMNNNLRSQSAREISHFIKDINKDLSHTKVTSNNSSVKDAKFSLNQESFKGGSSNAKISRHIQTNKGPEKTFFKNRSRRSDVKPYDSRSRDLSRFKRK